MAKATKVKQLTCELSNRVGLTAEISSKLGMAKVDILSICGYAMGDKAHFMLTVDNTAKAKKALSKMGVTISESDVIAVELLNKPGALGKVTGVIADAGIDIRYVFATALTGKVCSCVISSDDDKKAVKLINAAT